MKQSNDKSVGYSKQYF